MPQNDQALDTDGTYLQGSISATHSQLVATFGRPSNGSDGKTRAEWALDFDGCIATIYDWKQHGIGVADVTSWNIGGRGPDAALFVRNALDA